MNAKGDILNISDRYRQTVLGHVDAIKNSGRPVVIFGAGRAGWYIMKVLEHLGVPIAAFSDNNPDKQTMYFDYPVLSPADIAGKFPDAHVFLGVFIPGSAEAVQAQLRQMGFRNVYYEMAAFLFMYFVAAGRRCDGNSLAESIRILFENYREGAIHYGFTRDNYFVSPFVTSVITQKCTLHCRDCAQLIPYYKTPVHFSVESVISDLKQYAKAFDVVPEISLHGGEPFIHPEIGEICRRVAEIPNIVFISFVTNGTVVLSDNVLRQFAESGADVHQSGGYGELSRKRDPLYAAFRKYGIYSDIMFCSPSEMWTKAPPHRKLNRPAALNDAMYQGCVATKTCCQIMKGELHRCALSMHGSHQGLFPRCADDFVRLHEPNMQGGALVSTIRDFLTRDRALGVCDYCDPDSWTLVPPAIQLSGN